MEPHDTYYAYDDFGNLACVLPPAVDTSDGIDGPEFFNLIYEYFYDHRNRLVEKHIPGKGDNTPGGGDDLIVYNRLDQPIRAENKWLFTKYDAFGRVAYTGIKNVNISRWVFQGVVDDPSFGRPQYEQKTNTPTNIAGTTVHYTTAATPTVVDQVLTINYYDTYVDTGGLVIPTTVRGQPVTTNTQGLATVSNKNS